MAQCSGSGKGATPMDALTGLRKMELLIQKWNAILGFLVGVLGVFWLWFSLFLNTDLTFALKSGLSTTRAVSSRNCQKGSGLKLQLLV